MKALLLSCNLTTCSAHLNFIDLITPTILGEGTNYKVPVCEASSTPHSLPFWAKYSPQDPVLKFHDIIKGLKN
jgi:hypothetical protein